MTDWNFDVSAAPRTGRIIVATSCGKVTISQFLPKADRWEMLAKDEQPLAWQDWPEHPGKPEVAS